MDLKITYNDIHCLIQIDHYTFLIDDGNRRDRTFQEHVNNIEYRGIRACSGNWIIRILAFGNLMWRRRDIGADPEFS